MTMLRDLSVQWVKRQEALHVRGKAADRAVFDFFVGAATALELAYHPEAQHVRMCVSVVLKNAPFPIEAVGYWARGADPLEVVSRDAGTGETV